MRRHHETAMSAIAVALAMVIPAAGGLWARVLSLRQPARTTEKPAEASGDKRQP